MPGSSGAADGSPPFSPEQRDEIFRRSDPRRGAERVATPVFAIEVASLGTATVSAPSTRDAGLVPDVIDGSGVLEVTMEHITLLPGPHVLHTEITDFGRQHIYDHIQTALRFDVIAGDSQEVNGLVTMRPHWRLER